MTGVTILNEYTCLTDFRFLIGFAFGVGILIVSFIELLDDNYGEFCMGILFASAILALSIVMVNLSKSTRFEAVIDPSVPFVELMENYKIIERKGDIWVLEPLADSKTKNDS